MGPGAALQKPRSSQDFAGNQTVVTPSLRFSTARWGTALDTSLGVCMIATEADISWWSLSSLRSKRPCKVGSGLERQVGALRNTRLS